MSSRGVEFPGKELVLFNHLTWIRRMWRSGRWDRCTCWAGSRNRLHTNSGRLLLKEENGARSNKRKTCSCQVEDKTGRCCRLLPGLFFFFFFLLGKKKIHVMCLLFVKAASCRFGFSAPIWFELGHYPRFTQNFASEYFQSGAHQSPSQAFHSTFITDKRNRPTWQPLQAILFVHFFFLLCSEFLPVCVSTFFFVLFFCLFPTGCFGTVPLVPAPIR